MIKTSKIDKKLIEIITTIKPNEIKNNIEQQTLNFKKSNICTISRTKTISNLELV